MLNIVSVGDPKNPTLIIAHGLFGSAKNWGVLCKRLSDKWYVIAVDMRNHGGSKFYPVHNYEAMAEDLQKIVKTQGVDCSILGHSMGGKAAMFFALEQPKMVSKLIVIDIAPVKYSHSQNNIIEALQNINLEFVKSRKDADVQLASFLGDHQLRAFLLQSLELKDGVFWKLNLPVLKEYMTDIIGFPNTTKIFKGKTLLVVGENSNYVSSDDEVVMHKRFSELKTVVISDAGHWVHAEKPKELENTIRKFLSN